MEPVKKIIGSPDGYSYDQLMDDAFVALSGELEIEEEDDFSNISGKTVIAANGHTVQFSEFD